MTTERRLNYFVLAGTSGTGKTTALNRLSAEGFLCNEETARSVLSEQLAIQGPGLPSNNPQLFIQMMLERNKKAFENSKLATGPVFFDRGMPDLVHYAVRLTVDPAEFETASRTYLYNSNVFLFPPWKEIFVNDNERRMTFEKSIEFHELLVSKYQEQNYSLIPVPQSTIENRVKFILDRVASLNAN